MKRLAGIMAFMIVVAAFTVFMSGTNGVSVAQDTTETRINDLETLVARLETAVFPSASPNATPAQETGSVAAGSVTIEGTGTKLSEPFNLEDGQYRVELTYTIASSSDYVGIHIVNTAGEARLLFNTSADTGEWTESTLQGIDGGGSFLLQVEASVDTTWKVVFTPL